MTVEPVTSAEVVGPAAFPTVQTGEQAAARYDQMHPAWVLPRQLLLAQERAEWLGDQLRGQVDREGVHGVVGTSYQVTIDGRAVQVGEYTRVLFEQERAERLHVASLAERIAKLGLDPSSVTRSSARTLATAILGVVNELGLDRADDAVMRTMKRAGVAARRAMGLDDGDPDVVIGPPLSPDERVRLLREALDRAEQDAAPF
jgi:hypothetical protein